MQANSVSSTLLMEVMDKKGWMDLPAEGMSMYPLIHDGDQCRFVSLKEQSLKKGDIILFQDASGKLVAHRFLYIKFFGNRVKYLFKGDTNTICDEVISEEQMIGKLVKVRKENVTLTLDHPIAKGWSKLILLFPFISSFLQLILNKK
ncbi:signal peptidase I [Rossellomorea aquimaris]|uniref:signal peptidase I n=1 Tax=Rossellomorea aquimaris TaxID=189382 RepID=UPI0007D04159|nr:signal peptidase I [Rossellomorea aquimaris]